MKRITWHHRGSAMARGATWSLALLLGRSALAEEPPVKETVKETAVNITFAAPAGPRARLTVNADDAPGRVTRFKVVVGSAAGQTFTSATPQAARTIEVPADPRAFVRFGVEVPGAPANQGLALITPNSRPLLIPDACATWDLATSGSSASAACFARERHCPTASHASSDRKLTVEQCGQGSSMFCVPDYRIDVVGEDGQKVRVGLEGEPGKWLPLRSSAKVRHLRLPSGGRCPGVNVESGSDRVRLSLGWGQGVLVRVSASGQISAEELPPEKSAEAGGGGD
jgi:hypothetical protein